MEGIRNLFSEFFGTIGALDSIRVTVIMSDVYKRQVPKSIWPEVKEGVLAETAKLKVGDPRDFTSFMCAVIDKKAFDSIAGYIDYAKESPDAEVLCGGYDGSKGYFVQPTVIQALKPDFKTMKEEIFGPVMTVYAVSYTHLLHGGKRGLRGDGSRGLGSIIFTRHENTDDKYKYNHQCQRNQDAKQ